MTRKKKILFVTESHKLASGFGTYAKEILQRIYDTGKYEIAQFACYSPPTAFENTDWLTYGVAPMQHEQEYTKQHAENPAIQWGVTRFEHACLDFKPDIVMTYRDPWMDAFIAESSLRPFFHWVWMPTVDSEPQKDEWIYQLFNRCDGLLGYSEYAKRVIEDRTQGRVEVKDFASPGINPDDFYIISNKEKHKQKMGIAADSFVVGTVMRNQKRKMFPALMEAFAEFVKTAPADIGNKALLYLHTSYPEKMGWNITSLAHELGVGSKLVTTYVCRSCSKYFCSHYRDAITQCNHCGKIAAVLPGVANGIDHSELVNIYNVMDIYVQYAICEGFGMPQVEAAACGVPIASIDYSAMEDVVRYCKGFPIAPNLQREMETNADRSGANNQELVKILKSYAKKDVMQKNKKRIETREGCISRYTWDIAANVWEKYFDAVELKGLQGKWDAPPMIKQPPKEAPTNINHVNFCEWVWTALVQDQYNAWNYRMLADLRNLNFGADLGKALQPVTQESLFKEYYMLAEKRHVFDCLRTGILRQNKPEEFILQAHNRMKK